MYHRIRDVDLHPENLTNMEAIPFTGMKPLFKRLENVASYAT